MIYDDVEGGGRENVLDVILAGMVGDREARPGKIHDGLAEQRLTLKKG